MMTTSGIQGHNQGELSSHCSTSINYYKNL